MNLQDRLSAPDGSLRKNRRRSQISAPEKKKKLSIRCIKQSSVEARWDYR